MLSLEERLHCQIMREQGVPVPEIANTLGRPRSTIYHTLKRFEITGSHEDRARSGRPRLSSDRDDRFLIRSSLRNRKATAPDLRLAWQEAGVDASNTTVKRRLKDAGLCGHVAVKKPFLTERHKQARLNFAREHEHWSWVGWSVVLFSDKSKFNVFQNDGRVFVRRRSGERLHQDCISPTVKFGGGNVMVWSCMSYRGTRFMTRINGRLNARGYVGILEDFAIPSAHLLGYGDRFIFQDDNAPCHRANVVKEWAAVNDFRCMVWPAQSPD